MSLWHDRFFPLRRHNFFFWFFFSFSFYSEHLKKKKNKTIIACKICGDFFASDMTAKPPSVCWTVSIQGPLGILRGHECYTFVTWKAEPFRSQLCTRLLFSSALKSRLQPMESAKDPVIPTIPSKCEPFLLPIKPLNPHVHHHFILSFQHMHMDRHTSLSCL